MSLTTQQSSALGVYIESVPAWAALPNNSDTAFFIAAELQKPADPAFIVWKSNVAQDEIMQNGFDWTRVDNLSVGPARVWEWMFKNSSASINPSKPNVRSGIEAVWKGVAADLAVRAAVYVHCKRSASLIEKLFATGTGSDATPATMVFEGAVSYADVIEARNTQ